MEQVFNEIKKLLDLNKITYKVYDHEPTPTSKDAARVRGTKEEQGAKAIILRSEGQFFLCVLPGNERIDLKKLRLIITKKSLSLATKEEVLKVTNCVPGEVPPFGNIFKIKTLVDKSLLRNEEIAFNAGLMTKSIVMKTQDFLKIVNPIIEEFIE
ncbi:MAG: YbaK/EbsC family protein [Nanoarchaeota archaeon]